MIRVLGLTILLAVTATTAADDTKSDVKDSAMHPRVKMDTTLGAMVIELDAEKAPITVLNFLQYANEGFYEGTIFHRVMSTFMIQGGGFNKGMDKKSEGLRKGIKNEWENGLKNARGTIAMARMGRQPDSATSQFFINVVDNANLDRPNDGAAYAVFGKVVEGMDVMDKIRNTEVEQNDKYGKGRSKVVPVVPVVIKSVKLVAAFDLSALESKVKATEASAAKSADNAVAEQEALLKDWIEKAEKESNSKVTTTDTGLAFVDRKVGDGASPERTSRFKVHYTGWLTNGTKFDSSVDRGQPITFSLTGVIAGWTEGVGSMKVGGKRTLFIPPELGYGQRGSGGTIPPNAHLVFDVELLGIE